MSGVPPESPGERVREATKQDHRTYWGGGLPQDIKVRKRVSRRVGSAASPSGSTRCWRRGTGWSCSVPKAPAATAEAGPHHRFTPGPSEGGRRACGGSSKVISRPRTSSGP